MLTEKYKIKNEIRMPAAMFYSAAYNSLSRSAINTLLRCLQKRKWIVQGKGKKSKRVYLNEEFIFPYSEAELLGIGTTQHWMNIKKLIEVGFLDLAYQGGWYQKLESEKDYSRYKLSDRWRDYGNQEFKKVEKKKVLKENNYIQKNIERKNIKLSSLKRRCHLHISEGDRPKNELIRLHKTEDDNQENRNLETTVCVG